MGEKTENSLSIILHDILQGGTISPSIEFVYAGESYKPNASDVLLIDLDERGQVKQITPLADETNVQSYEIEKTASGVNLHISGKFKEGSNQQFGSLSKSTEFSNFVRDASAQELIEELLLRNNIVRSLLEEARSQGFFEKEIPEPQTVFDKHGRQLSSPQTIDNRSDETTNSEPLPNQKHNTNPLSRSSSPSPLSVVSPLRDSPLSSSSGSPIFDQMMDGVLNDNEQYSSLKGITPKSPLMRASSPFKNGEQYGGVVLPRMYSRDPNVSGTKPKALFFDEDPPINAQNSGTPNFNNLTSAEIAKPQARKLLNDRNFDF